MFVEEVLVRSINDLGAIALIERGGRAVLGRSAAGPRGALA